VNRAGDPAGRGNGREPVLRHLVDAETHRWTAAESMAADPARLAAGWERRFVAAGTRADEAIALYRELGYDVAADAVQPDDLAGACADCAIVAALHFRMIYTRRRT
jgi:hypothetical protein